MDRPKTIREVVDLYMAHAKYSANALKIRTRFLRELVKDFGDCAVEACCPGDLVLWIHGHKSWASPWTVRTAARIVQRPFNWAAKLRLIASNPFYGVSYEEGEPRRPMTDSEFRRLYKGASDHLFRRVLLFLRWTGCRPGEMARATWMDVDWELAMVVLPEHKSKKKTRKPRAIPLSGRCLKMLHWMRRCATGDGVIFTTRRGTAWTGESIYARMENLKRRLELPKDCVLYGTRHAFGTNGVLRGANLTLLSKAMGHSSISITCRYYVHVDREFDAIRGAAEIAGK